MSAQSPTDDDASLVGAPLPEGFRLPDWNEPLDVFTCCLAIPETATVKGMFFASLERQIRAHGGKGSEKRFRPFHHYPMRLCLERAADCARTVHPDLPLRDGLRRIARPAYSTFADSLVGRVIFAALGRDVGAVLQMASRAWPHAASRGRLETRIVDATTAIIHVVDFYLTEPLAVGIAEGAVEACGKQCLVALKRLSHTEGEFLIRWS